MRSLEAVETALLLALLVGVVESLHAGFEVCAFRFDTQTGVAFFFDGLERVARCAALLAHHGELLFKAGTLLLVLVQVRLGLCVGSFEVGQRVFKSSCKLLLGKQVLLDSANASLLIFDQLGMSNVFALMTRGWR